MFGLGFLEPVAFVRWCSFLILVVALVASWLGLIVGALGCLCCIGWLCGCYGCDHLDCSRWFGLVVCWGDRLGV